MARVSVYYATKDSPHRFMVDKDNLPTPSEIEAQYYLVADYEDVIDEPEGVFVRMNLEPETVFNYDAYNHGVQHTSMSVGDVCIIDNKGYICLPTGWKEFKFG